MSNKLSSEALLILAGLNIDQAIHDDNPLRRLRVAREAIYEVMIRLEEANESN